MKEYTVKLNEEKTLVSSANESINEIQMVLQVWQDLTRLEGISSLQQEDSLVKNILEQILETQYKDKESIPMPDYYMAKKDVEE